MKKIPLQYSMRCQTGIQCASESELDFCLRAMSLRQKVIMLVNEEDFPYDSQLIKKCIFHAIFTGLKHNNVRHEL